MRFTLTKFIQSPSCLLGLFILWALVLTYPLPLHLFSHIPRGSEEAATVPLFNLWTLQWNIDQQLRGYPRYWDAPIFAPDQGAFAFSEPQPLTALLAAPLWLAFQSAALGYNAVVILFLTLNGWFAYWLLRTWRVSAMPSLLAGLLMQSLPFITQEMGVLQLIAIFGFLWSLLFLSRFLKPVPPLRILSLSKGCPSALWQNGLGLALGPPITFLTCGYYGLFSLLIVPLAFVFQLRREHLHLKTIGGLVAAGLLAAILTGPFLWAQQQRLADYHFTRSAKTIESNSAKLEYYSDFLDNNLLYGRILGLKSGQGQRLFPGLGLLLLAGLGLLGRRAKWVKFYLLTAIAVGLLLSLGLRLSLGGFGPYQWVREYVPGFAQLRSPFRLAALVQLHLALLAGFGLDNLRRWLRLRDRKAVPTFKGVNTPGSNRLLLVIAALTIFELLALPLPLQPVPAWPEALPWQTWLNERPQTPRIVLLPFAPSSKVEDFEQTARWMLLNRSLAGTMLNGYSGFFPADHVRVRDELLKFPGPKGVQLLRDKQIDYVVIYHHLADAPPQTEVISYLPLVFYDKTNHIAIYALRK